MVLSFYFSNKMEVLLDILSKKYSKYSTSIFSKEIIVIQTKGMAKWVSLEFALKLGIAANIEFLFPNNFIQLVSEYVNPQINKKAIKEKWNLVFKIYNILKNKEVLNEKDFLPLKNYLKDDTDNAKTLQLSFQIADTFDQYQIYRPQMIESWDKGVFNFRNKDLNKWQPLLWQKIFNNNELHRTSVFNELIENVNKVDKLFEKVSFFGISVLPPVHLKILEEISKKTDVDVYLLNPCREYWGDIKSDKEIKYIVKRSKATQEGLILEEINYLLASLGKLGREFNEMILECENSESFEYFEDIKVNSHLTQIQDDLLKLTNTDESEKLLWNKKDKSISIHSCHSKMREIQILYDNILDVLNNDEDVSPSDILVISPQIVDYVSIINSIFNNEDVKIPYSISDLPDTFISFFMEVILSVARLLESRFKASDVLGILEQEPVSRKFGISHSDLDKIIHWFEEANIRWAKDKDLLDEYGNFDIDSISFKQGVRRLVTGFATYAENNNNDFRSVYPVKSFDESDRHLLGSFLDFVEILKDLSDEVKVEKTGKEWFEFYGKLIESLFSSENEFESSYLNVLKIINKLVEKMEDDVLLSFKNFTLSFKKMFDEELSSRGFIAGGITFCAMIPMRSIPFKMICVIGLNMGTFPRVKKPLEFDLIKDNPQKGDRSQKDSDRYLFLETILSARKYLYISYIGQSIFTNDEIPPSILVTELIEYIKSRFKTDDDIVIKHKLQPYHSDYFKNKTELFSYSKTYLEIAKSRGILEDMPALINGDLRDIDEVKNIGLNDLIDFFGNPVKYFYNKILGIYLRDNYNDIKDTENFVIDSLESYQIKDKIIKDIVKTNDILLIENDLNYFYKTGKLPFKNTGNFYKDKIKNELIEFYEISKDFIKLYKETIVKETKLENINIFCKFENVTENEIVFLRMSKLKGKDLISGLITHIASNCFDDMPKKTVVISSDKILNFSKIQEPEKILSKLVGLFIEGQKYPLCFFPDIFIEFIEKNEVYEEKEVNYILKETDYHSVDVYLKHFYSEITPDIDKIKRNNEVFYQLLSDENILKTENSDE